MALYAGLAMIALSIGLGSYLLLARTRPAPASAAADEFALSVPAPTALTTRDVDPEDIPPLFRRMQRVASALSPSDYSQRLSRRLGRAGNPRRFPAERVLAYKGFGLVAGALLGVTFGAKYGGVYVLAIPAVLAAAGLFLPDVLVHNVGQHRQLELQKGLPDAMDMLTLCVEAGLGFDAAVARVARNLEGPVAEEWSRVLQEMQVGQSRTQALRSLAERTDVPELRTFVSAMIQASEMGISIGLVLREQSKEMRIKRRQRAEEKAQKLQVKILLPLISCLMPSMFIVVLGPAVIQMIGFFRSVNH